MLNYIALWYPLYICMRWAFAIGKCMVLLDQACKTFRGWEKKVFVTSLYCLKLLQTMCPGDDVCWLTSTGRCVVLLQGWYQVSSYEDIPEGKLEQLELLCDPWTCILQVFMYPLCSHVKHSLILGAPLSAMTDMLNCDFAKATKMFCILIKNS